MSDRGLAVLGFPSTDFGGREPGSNRQIKQFCTTRFGVSFPMFAKITVKGEGRHPLYRYLTDADAGHGFGGPITWNFNKFPVGPDGRVPARFGSKARPGSEEIVAALEEALGG